MPVQSFRRKWPEGELFEHASTELGRQIDEYFSAYQDRRLLSRFPTKAAAVHTTENGRALLRLVIYENAQQSLPLLPGEFKNLKELPDTPEFREKLR